MRVMLLNDDTWDLLNHVLSGTSDGREVLARFETSEKLPSDRQTLAIVRGARTDPGVVPDVVQLAVERRDAGRSVSDETREAVERLLFHLSEAGVPPSVLIRWFGYSPARIFQLLSKRETATA